MNQLYSNQEKYILLEVIPTKGIDQEKKSLAEISVRYNNLSTYKQDIVNADVMIAYTKSMQLVKDSMIETIVVDSEIQKVNIANQTAIKLIDEGKKEEATALVNYSRGNFISNISGSVKNSNAVKKAKEYEAQLENLSQKLDQSDSKNSRKIIIEDSFKTKKQQK